MEVGKAEIAYRLVNEAIRGRVRGDDVLTVHLGAMSAFVVSRDLCEKRGLGRSTIDSLIREDARKAFWKRFARLNNAFKHADRDPDATFDLAGLDGFTEMVILLTVENLRRLNHPGVPGIWGGYATACFLADHPEAMPPEAPAHYRYAACSGLFRRLDHDRFRALARNPEMEREALAELLASESRGQA